LAGGHELLYRYSDSWEVDHDASDQYINAIWGNVPLDIFAVGNGGLILHYDGVWTQQTSTSAENLYGVWGVGDDVFAVGTDGELLRRFGGDWTNPGTPTGFANPDGEDLYAIWGTSLVDITAVGAAGVIVHYDGVDWSDQPSGVMSDLWGVWGSASNNVFAVGDSGVILHRCGAP
jgi:hypothetical protein